MNIRQRTFRVKPYNARVTVAFTHQQVYDLTHDIMPPDMLGAVYHSSTFDYVLALPNKREQHTIWHEALHIALTMFKDSDDAINPCDQQELVCYTQGYIVEEIYKVIDKYYAWLAKQEKAE